MRMGFGKETKYLFEKCKQYVHVYNYNILTYTVCTSQRDTICIHVPVYIYMCIIGALFTSVIILNSYSFSY